MKNGMRNGTLALGLALALLLAPAGAGAGSKKVEWKKQAASERLVSNAYRYLGADQAKKALKFLEKAAKTAENASAYEALGECWNALGKDKKAQEAWDKADKLNGGRGSADFRGGDKADQAVQNGAVASKLSYQGYAWAAKGDYKYAVELFKKAVAADPQYWNAQAGLDAIAAKGLDASQTLPSRAGSGAVDSGKDEGGATDIDDDSADGGKDAADKDDSGGKDK